MLIDTPPALGELTRNALTASDLGLVVTEPSLFALQGAQQALDAMSVVRDTNLRLQVAGIVVNRVRPTSSEHRYRMAELALAYGDLLLAAAAARPGSHPAGGGGLHARAHLAHPGWTRGGSHLRRVPRPRARHTGRAQTSPTRVGCTGVLNASK